MGARRWSEAQRAQQADKIQMWKPWTKSTGARTARGKAVVARNAFTGGDRPKLRAMAARLRYLKENLGQTH